MTLGEALQSNRSRNLDVLRLCLAIAVIFSHAWPLTLGPGASEPLEDWTGRALGGWAVGVFFFISGLLITGSAERKSAKLFWSARAHRIVPGLLVALLVTLVLALASGSTASVSEAVAWFVRAGTLVSIEHRLTGAFATNPFPEVVNGPLWSLFHEVVAYIVCALFVWSGGTRSPKAVLAFVALAAVAAIAQGVLPGRVATFAPLFAAFALGMVAHVWRDQISLAPATLAFSLAVALVLPWSLAMGAVGLGLVVLALRAPLLQLRGDVSYGMYIYGWPVTQALVAVNPGIDPLALGVLSVLATFPLAWMSWICVERPGLAIRRAPV